MSITRTIRQLGVTDERSPIVTQSNDNMSATTNGHVYAVMKIIVYIILILHLSEHAINRIDTTVLLTVSSTEMGKKN